MNLLLLLLLLQKKKVTKKNGSCLQFLQTATICITFTLFSIKNIGSGKILKTFPPKKLSMFLMFPFPQMTYGPRLLNTVHFVYSNKKRNKNNF